MIEMTPNDIACMRVGRFLQTWSIMEAEIRRAIEKALGLNTIQGLIVCANISLRDKVNILKTAVHISSIYPEAERDRFKKELTDLQNYAPIRNMIAHDMFSAKEDNGVQVSFHVVKAKGKLDMPDIEWDVIRFHEEYAKIDGFANVLRELTKRLEAVVAVTQFAKIFHEFSQDVPNPTPIGRGILGSLNLQAPELLRSDPAPSSEETKPQTPESPQE